MTKGDAESGWSLVEVLVAFSVLVSAITMGFLIVSEGAHRSAQAKSATDLQNDSNFLLTEIRSNPPHSLSQRVAKTRDGREWLIVFERLPGFQQATSIVQPVRVRILNSSKKNSHEEATLETILVLNVPK